MIVNGVPIGRDVFNPTNEDFPGPGQYKIKEPIHTSFSKLGFFSKIPTNQKIQTFENIPHDSAPNVSNNFDGTKSPLPPRTSHTPSSSFKSLQRSFSRASNGKSRHRDSEAFKDLPNPKKTIFNFFPNSCPKCENLNIDELIAKNKDLTSQISSLKIKLSSKRNHSNHKIPNTRLSDKTRLSSYDSIRNSIDEFPKADLELGANYLSNILNSLESPNPTLEETVLNGARDFLSKIKNYLAKSSLDNTKISADPNLKLPFDSISQSNSSFNAESVNSSLNDACSSIIKGERHGDTDFNLYSLDLSINSKDSPTEKYSEVEQLKSELSRISLVEFPKIPELESQSALNSEESNLKISDLESQIKSAKGPLNKNIADSKINLDSSNDFTIKKISELESKLSEVSESYNQKIIDLENQKGSIIKLNNEKVSRLESDFEFARSSNNKLICELESQILLLNTQKDSRISQLESELLHVSQLNQHKITQLESQMELILKNNEEKVSKMELEFNSLNDSKKVEIIELNSTIDSNIKKITELESQIVEISYLKDQEVSKTKSQINLITKEKNEKIAGLESQIGSLEELKNLNLEITNQKNDAEKRISSIHVLVNQLNSKNRSLNEEIISLKNEKDTLKSSLQMKDNLYDEKCQILTEQLKSIKIESESAIFDLSKNLEEKESIIASIKQELTDSVSECTRLEMLIHNDDSKSKLSQANQLIVDLTSRIKLLEENSANQKTKEEDYELNLEYFKNTLSTLQNDANSKLKENSDLSQQLSISKYELTVLKEEKSALENKNRTLSDQTQKLKLDLDKLSKSESMLKSEIYELTTEHRELISSNSANLESISLRNESLERTVKDLTNKYTKLESQLEIAESDLKLNEIELSKKSLMYISESEKVKSLLNSLENSDNSIKELKAKSDVLMKKWSDAEQRCLESEEAVRLINNKFVSAMDELNNLESQLARKE
ncbi:hypothetical protein AYI68_g2596 [Smittium mucronatum]|uniref:Uncharacterized protein n=1 Tax=Smittium mucronatum TaxID=133383 RepID=A0A1R0H290_9FUNG|nr:hypothetical protein AYI68_g2596 [Smittium mucronatum]